MTSFHGLHVLIGVVWAAGRDVRRRGATGSRSRSYEGVEIFGLYWHFVDVVWIILFMLIYLI